MMSRHILKRGGVCSLCICPLSEAVGGVAFVGEVALVGGAAFVAGVAEEEGVDETRHQDNFCKGVINLFSKII